MIIRATKKVLSLSKIESVKLNKDDSIEFPGEWYADLISLGKPGKFGIQYLHSFTKLTVIVQGRSILKEIEQFRSRVKSILIRHDFEKLIPYFDLDSEVNIYSSSNRSYQAHMNQIKRTSEYHCAKAKSIDKINFRWIEDIFLDYPFQSQRTGNVYQNTERILKKYMENFGLGS